MTHPRRDLDESCCLGSSRPLSQLCEVVYSVKTIWYDINVTKLNREMNGRFNVNKLLSSEINARVLVSFQAPVPHRCGRRCCDCVVERVRHPGGYRCACRIRRDPDGWHSASSGKSTDELGDKLTPYDSVTHYNNYYEFSLDKEEPSRLRKVSKISPWTVQVAVW